MDTKEKLCYNNTSAAIFLEHQTVKGDCVSFVSRWAARHITFLERMQVNQSSSFTSVKYANHILTTGTEKKPSYFEAYSALGDGERYQAPLHMLYSNFKLESPNLEPKDAVKLAVNAIDDTTESTGLVP